jgi:hypothetical protein
MTRTYDISINNFKSTSELDTEPFGIILQESKTLMLISIESLLFRII